MKSTLSNRRRGIGDGGKGGREGSKEVNEWRTEDQIPKMNQLKGGEKSTRSSKHRWKRKVY